MSLKLKELILLLNNTNQKNEIHHVLANLFNPTKVKFKEVIHANLLSDLSLEEFALILNMSVSTFKRTFKKEFNESPHQYIKNQKLKKAAELLRLPNDGISAVAYDCGFNSIAHFSKAFKERFGVSPREY